MTLDSRSLALQKSAKMTNFKIWKHTKLAPLQYFANSDNDIFAKQAVFNNDEKSDNTKHISHCLECCPKIPLTHS